MWEEMRKAVQCLQEKTYKRAKSFEHCKTESMNTCCVGQRGIF